MFVYRRREDELKGMGLLFGVRVNFFGREMMSGEIIKHSVWMLF